MIWPAQVVGKKTYHWKAADRRNAQIQAAYMQWRAGFANSPDGKVALSELDLLRNRNPRKFPGFQEDILFACWCAQAYGRFGISPDKGRVEAWKHLRSSIPRQLKAIETAEEFVKNNPLLSSMILEEAFDNTPSLKSIVHIESAFAELLSNYKSALVHFQDGGLSIGRYERPSIACIEYRKRVRSGYRSDEEARAGLEFELALRFRAWTSGKTGSILKQKMPSSGNAHYRLIARLLKATLPHLKVNIDVEPRMIRNRLHRFKHTYPDAAYVGWPILATRP